MNDVGSVAQFLAISKQMGQMTFGPTSPVGHNGRWRFGNPVGRHNQQEQIHE